MSVKETLSARQVASLELLQTPTSVVASVIGMLVAIALWLTALDNIDVAHMNDLGLISVLPPAFLLALGTITLAFFLALQTEPFPTALVCLMVIVLIMMLYGTLALLEDQPRFSVTWRHIGVMDTIQRTGASDPSIDAYFNWPGFFAFGAFVRDLLGPDSSILFGTWASMVFNLLWLLPLLMLFESFTENQRLIWLGIWFFYSANWIGQDYLSPQALNYFLYLVILAIVVRWFRIPSAPLPLLQRERGSLARLTNQVQMWFLLPEKTNAPLRSGQQAGLVLVMVVLFSSIVASHQLTPFAVMLSIAALVVFHRTSVRGLPLLMMVLVLAWLVYMAEAYLNGHFEAMIHNLGQLGSSTNSNVSERLAGSPEHQFVIHLRIVMSLGIWMLAAVGAARRLRQKQGDTTLILLAGAPFAVLGLQSYGGEALLRIYLFSLPFMAFLVAGIFFSKETEQITLHPALVAGILGMMLLGGFLVTRYGNERMDYKTTQEIDSMRMVYQAAPEDSLLLALNPNIAWKFQDYEKYTYRVANRELDTVTADTIIDLLQDSRYNNAYLIITRSQRAYSELMLGVSPDAQRQLEQDLAASPRLQVLFSTRDATVLARVNNRATPAYVEVAASGASATMSIVMGLGVLCLILAPGFAVVGWLELPNLWAGVTIAIALGVALVTLLTTAAAYTTLWSPDGFAGIILLFSVLVFTRNLIVYRKRYAR